MAAMQWSVASMSFRLKCDEEVTLECMPVTNLPSITLLPGSETLSNVVDVVLEHVVPDDIVPTKRHEYCTQTEVRPR